MKTSWETVVGRGVVAIGLLHLFVAAIVALLVFALAGLRHETVQHTLAHLRYKPTVYVLTIAWFGCTGLSAFIIGCALLRRHAWAHKALLWFTGVLCGLYAIGLVREVVNAVARPHHGKAAWMLFGSGVFKAAWTIGLFMLWRFLVHRNAAVHVGERVQPARPGTSLTD